MPSVLRARRAIWTEIGQGSTALMGLLVAAIQRTWHRHIGVGVQVELKVCRGVLE